MNRPTCALCNDPEYFSWPHDRNEYLYGNEATRARLFRLHYPYDCGSDLEMENGYVYPAAYLDAAGRI